MFGSFVCPAFIQKDMTRKKGCLHKKKKRKEKGGEKMYFLCEQKQLKRNVYFKKQINEQCGKTYQHNSFCKQFNYFQAL